MAKKILDFFLYPTSQWTPYPPTNTAAGVCIGGSDMVYGSHVYYHNAILPTEPKSSVAVAVVLLSMYDYSLNFTMQSIQIGIDVIVSINTLAGCISSNAIRSEI